MTPKQEDIQFRLLWRLQGEPQITQRELASRLGISLGATNYALSELMKKGAIKIKNFQANRRKLNYAYSLTPQGMAQKAALTASFLARKLQEYEALKTEIEAVSREKI